MADLTDLIRRLEEASEGSRELDYRIAYAAGHPEAEPWDRMQWCMRGSKRDKAIPSYCTSLDAALTLVPEGHVGRIGFGGPGYVFAFAATPRDWGAGRVNTVRAASPAISLCIAALRARALSKEG